MPGYAEMTAVGSNEACAYQTPIYFPTSFLFVRGAITTDGAKFEAAQWSILIRDTTLSDSATGAIF